MYNYIIVDSVNMGYQVLNKASDIDIRKETFKFGGKRVYKTFLKEFLNTVKFLKSKFLEPTGEIIFLFDNYESREEIRNMLKPLDESAKRKDINPEYKAKRKKERAEFYASLDTLRYFFLVGDKNTLTARIPNLEADDLVKPCIKNIREKVNNPKILMITNDSDWCRYLDEYTDYLPNLYKDPVNKDQFTQIHGYVPTEDSVILNKILYGDSADHIDAVFPEMSVKSKKYITDNFSSVVDLMYDVSKHEELSEYITMVKDKEKDIRITYQMLASIPVKDEHFKAVLTKGRNSSTMINAMNELIFDNEENKPAKFSFGGIKVPRYTP